jgi:hypothetical protein
MRKRLLTAANLSRFRHIAPSTSWETRKIVAKNREEGQQAENGLCHIS